MDEITNDIVDEINGLEIYCPDCRYIGDDEYTCTVCWCEGGNGRINVVRWIAENKKHFKI